MSPRAVSNIISVLQRAELQLAARVNFISPRRSSEEIGRRALQIELSLYEEVDTACLVVAEVLTQWAEIKFCDVPLVVADKFCEPVVFRLRDANRLLVECKGPPSEFAKKTGPLFTDLLVHRWHSYAERYWKQRWVRGQMGEHAGSVR